MNMVVMGVSHDLLENELVGRGLLSQCFSKLCSYLVFKTRIGIRITVKVIKDNLTLSGFGTDVVVQKTTSRGQKCSN